MRRNIILTYVLPALALAGLVAGIVYASRTSAPPAPVPPVADPAAPPYEKYISGSGIVEAASRDVGVATPTSGVIVEIPVTVGDAVRKGDLLFRLDDRERKAALAEQKAALVVARAKVVEARVALEKARADAARVRSLRDGRAVSAEEAAQRGYAEETARAALASATADVTQAEAAARAIEVDLDRLCVRAPMDATVLQVNVSEGEYATAGALSTPLVMLGDVTRLHVRVDIDENIAWRYRAGMPATVFLRGNRDFSAPLRFVRVEPYVLPKTSLTGDTTERVDIRVLQVLYAFDTRDMAAYVGQQVDVYFDDTGRDAAAGAKQPGRKDGNKGGSATAARSGAAGVAPSAPFGPSGQSGQSGHSAWPVQSVRPAQAGESAALPEVVVPVRDARARTNGKDAARGVGVRG
ncbi:efflux RND transporter periplasmic adaptor subunit [Nitratidesulfovibrio sp. HK-II]|uniref:efflux RND transporter periplasmic adaptor subunit n=1 Tax=Nitratidesulfovibrio sp. HK-II TaxID=2009266 RepID=UPI000E2F74E3|nr:efflux RND transporter periplasmic adaptor subunit [Nitratidesulfovibrio sp. HK-II]GBO97949.1 secretion protein HlyD family protein [Nitratidesulfovibrio sp. HK-II]